MTPYWTEAIDAAEKRGGFTEEDKDNAREWPTCACGQQDERIPREEYGSPKDQQLAGDGVSFDQAVWFDDLDLAREVMGRIEARAAVVLAKQEEHEEQP